MIRRPRNLTQAFAYGGAGYVLRRMVAPVYVEWLIVERELAHAEPRPPADGRLQFADLTGSSPPEFAFPHLSERSVSARLAAGHMCFSMLYDGIPIATIWARDDAMWLPFLRRRFALRPGEVYLYDSYTHPDHRGKGVTKERYVHTHAALVKRGFQTARGYVLVGNEPALAAARAAGAKVVARHRWLHLGPCGIEIGTPAFGRLGLGRDSELPEPPAVSYVPAGAGSG